LPPYFSLFLLTGEKAESSYALAWKWMLSIRMRKVSPQPLRGDLEQGTALSEGRSSRDRPVFRLCRHTHGFRRRLSCKPTRSGIEVPSAGWVENGSCDAFVQRLSRRHSWWVPTILDRARLEWSWGCCADAGWHIPVDTSDCEVVPGFTTATASQLCNAFLLRRQQFQVHQCTGPGQFRSLPNRAPDRKPVSVCGGVCESRPPATLPMRFVSEWRAHPSGSIFASSCRNRATK